MRSLTRRGWTLHEMIISLSVMSVAVGLAAHASLVQLRLFRGAGEIVAVRGQTVAVGAVVAAALWGVSPAGGDIIFASDSALEVRGALGSAVVCAGATGRITIPTPEPLGNTVSGFDAMPDAGDVADLFVDDSTGSGWIRATVASAAPSGAVCPAFPQAPGTIVLTLREPLEVPVGAVLRLSRPVRLSHYRASDGKWYFGVRDWNTASQRLNTVQPVAGPLEPHSGDHARTGLALRYFDLTGTELPIPTDPTRIATIEVSVRARSPRPVRIAGMVREGVVFSDSASTIVAMRNVW